VPVGWRDATARLRETQARVTDFAHGRADCTRNNRFVAVRELKLTGLRAPSYNRRADLVCFADTAFAEDDKQMVASRVYRHVWQQSAAPSRGHSYPAT
jgi:hypothetical protein